MKPSTKQHVVDVTSVTSYPQGPQVLVQFPVDEHLMLLEQLVGTDGVVDFSFDGVTDDGQLRKGAPNQGIGGYGGFNKIWFKKNAGTGTITVRIMSQQKLLARRI